MLSAKRLYLVLCSLVAVALLTVAGGAYAAQSLLKSKSTDVYDARLNSMVLEEKQNRLRKAKTDITKYDGLAQIAKSIVPRDKDQARTVREISKLAAANGISLGSISFPSSSLGAKSPADTQLKAVPTIPGTFSLGITVRSDSKRPTTYERFTNFLEDLERNRRTALVTGITLTPDTVNPNNVLFSLTIEEYIKP